MTGKEVLRELMNRMGIKQQAMMDGLKDGFGETVSQASLADRLNTKKSNNITVGNLNRMLWVLGYKAVVMPKNLPTPSGGFVLEDGLTTKEAG